MRVAIFWATVLLGAFQVGCDRSMTSAEQSSSVVSAEPSPSVTVRAPSTQSLIPTQRLTPQPIRVTLDQLPSPYHTNSASKGPNLVPVPAQPRLNVPPGFTVNVFAEGLTRPRWLALTPAGDVLVTETPENRIRLLQDTNKDGVADVRKSFAGPENGLNLPFGMAFTDNAFFVANTDAVLKFPYQAKQDRLAGRGQKITDLPGQGYNQHWTRNVVVSPDRRKLYVSVGSATNADPEPLPRAAVLVMNLDGTDRQIFASGLRNPVGLDFHPQTGELYTTVNERDGLGDDLVPDYLTRLRQGEFYGWPYAYFSPKRLDPRLVRQGRSERPDLVAKTRMPDVLFQAHSAALGLRFYNGKTFPTRYHNGAFVAFRGSWNRDRGTGYKIVFVPFDRQGRSQGYYEDFLTGFLVDPSGPTTWGRPVGVLTLPDGSVIFTEEGNGRIYRIQYRGT